MNLWVRLSLCDIVVVCVSLYEFVGLCEFVILCESL